VVLTQLRGRPLHSRPVPHAPCDDGPGLRTRSQGRGGCVRQPRVRQGVEVDERGEPRDAACASTQQNEWRLFREQIGRGLRIGDVHACDA
jgi:hypothetical protein